jgi:hypothetical protein
MKVIMRKIFFLFILCVFCRSEALANPQISSLDGSLFHGNNVVINGSGFGSKSSATPQCWDDAESGSIGDHWDGLYPYTCSNSDHNIHYDTTAGLGRGVAQAHSSSTRYIVGCHSPEGYSPFNNTKGPNVLVGKIVEPGSYTYSAYYYRHDPDWNEATDNYKQGRYSTAWLEVPNGYTGGGFYITMGNVLMPPYVWRTNYCTPNWNASENSLDPGDGWMKREIIVHHTNDSTGWIDIYEDGNLIDYDNGHSWVGNPSSTSFDRVVFGGYNRLGDTNNFRYWDDIYHDNTLARVIIGNASTLASSTVREVQIPTAWSDNSITITVNQASFSLCEPLYLYVVDANGVVSDCTARKGPLGSEGTQGFPVYFPTSTGQKPCYPRPLTGTKAP